MAATNMAQKFEKKVQESFVINSITQNAVNHDYDFMGVDTIKVYSMGTAPMKNYTKSGTQRYGSPDELTDTIQTMKLTRDRSFTFVIDKKDNQDTMGVFEVGRALKRQIEEVVIPEIDKYRLCEIVKKSKENAGTNYVKINKADGKKAYENFLNGIGVMLDKGVPMAGTFAYISTDFYKAIRLDPTFIQASDMAQEMRLKGVVGMVEGIPLIHVPSTYFPNESASGETGYLVDFMLMNKAAVLGAEKLTEYKVHDNPPGINGWLVEGRLRYDVFVLDKKKDMIYTCMKKTS